MAKQVYFTVNLKINGKDVFVEAGDDARKFAQELGLAKNKTEELKASVLHINQVSQAFNNAFSGLQQLTSIMSQYTASYNAQIEAETKLATNMRNTMGARESQIQNIKDFCAAQQQIGVVGDEVQLAGAQELAIHLRNADTMKKLIPLMNDLAVKQDGVKVSSSTITSVATMMGKAMDGNAGALKRAGIVLDAYQEKIIKTGTEEEKAAILVEVLNAKVGGLNAELAKTDAGRAQQAANAFGDWKERIGSLFSFLTLD